MSTGEPQGDPTGGRQPTEEELRAAYEAEVKKIRVEQVVLEQIVTLINLGMRRTGLTPGTEDERDLGQVRLAIESIRVQLPLIEQVAPGQVGPIRDALSQLQMAYVRLGGSPAGGAEGAGAADSATGSEPSTASPSGSPEGGPAPAEQPDGVKSGDAGPAQRSGRLWIPGQ
ncbi:MAG: hypothetical protein ABI323_11250 [Solirubrobacteraceae bacterium]